MEYSFMNKCTEGSLCIHWKIIAFSISNLPCRVMMSTYDYFDYSTKVSVQHAWILIPHNQGPNVMVNRLTLFVWFCLQETVSVPGAHPCYAVDVPGLPVISASKTTPVPLVRHTLPSFSAPVMSWRSVTLNNSSAPRQHSSSPNMTITLNDTLSLISSHFK